MATMARIAPLETPVTTYTHPDCPGVALRAEDLGGGKWRRSLLIDGTAVHAKDWTERDSTRQSAQVQASQAGFWLTAIAQSPLDRESASIRTIIGDRQADIDELASHVAFGRASIQPPASHQ